MLRIIAGFFKGSSVWANIILVVGIVCTLSLFLLAMKAGNQYIKALLAGASYSQINPTGISVRLLFYFLPMFFVIWIYRYGDYDELKMNVRRLMVYTVVAVLILLNHDPITKLFMVTPPPNNINTDFPRFFNEFSVVAFLAFDRAGKVLIEIFAKAGSRERN